jgi:hypothetical protein
MDCEIIKLYKKTGSGRISITNIIFLKKEKGTNKTKIIFFHILCLNSNQ